MNRYIGKSESKGEFVRRIMREQALVIKIPLGLAGHSSSIILQAGFRTHQVKNGTGPRSVYTVQPVLKQNS
jgi:hypothetical protein